MRSKKPVRKPTRRSGRLRGVSAATSSSSLTDTPSSSLILPTEAGALEQESKGSSSTTIINDEANKPRLLSPDKNEPLYSVGPFQIMRVYATTGNINENGKEELERKSISPSVVPNNTTNFSPKGKQLKTPFRNRRRLVVQSQWDLKTETTMNEDEKWDTVGSVDNMSCPSTLDATSDTPEINSNVQ